MMWTRRLALEVVLIAVSFSGSLLASDWLQWRGPNYDGSTSAKGLPVKFDREKNIKWKLPLIGPAGSTPIVVGDNVFLTAFDRKLLKVIGLAVDRSTGRIRWQDQLGEGHDDRDRGMENFLASPSAVSDGEMVIFFTGAGDVVRYDRAGKKVWRINLQDRHGGFNMMHGYGASPLLFRNRLFVQVLHRDRPYPDQMKRGKLVPESYLLAIDPDSGETMYRHVRPTDAIDEGRESYATPIPHVVRDHVEILIVGGNYLTAHDFDTGKELWRYGSWNPTQNRSFRIVPSPLVGAGLIYTAVPFHGPVIAINAAKGNTQERWKLERNTSDTPTPLFYNGKLYVLDGKKRFLSCIEPETGKVVRAGRLPCDLYMRASPTAADGKIYIMNADGEVFVVRADGAETESSSKGKVPSFEILHQVDMGEYPSRSSISIAHDNLFIRTADTLYCVGK